MKFMFLFLLIPLAGCAYVGWHVWRLLPLAAAWRAVIVALMLACFALLFVNFAVGLDQIPLLLARVMYAVGTSSLIILLYLFMLFLALDLGRLIRLMPPSFLKDSWAGTLTVLGVMLAVFVYGNLHYHHKVRVPLEAVSAKPLPRPLKIILMSDMHLGYHNTRSSLARWVDQLNREQADLVLIAGDIVDISVRPLLEEDMAAEFRRLNAPVYACLGNHDYYAGEPNSERFYRESDIHLLRDEATLLADSSLLVIGRDDRTNLRRKSVRQLAADAAALSPSAFTLLLDHQPYHLEEAEQAGIDFQFSGHTHYGQVWPISWIEDAIYECAFGSHQRGRTQYYVSSGIGIWGGKFRIGTRSEYVVLTVNPAVSEEADTLAGESQR